MYVFYSKSLFLTLISCKVTKEMETETEVAPKILKLFKYIFLVPKHVV
jgi:hypothetical protein